MSVRQSLLAILDQGPCYGYQLRTEFDRRTGSTWPLNVGQIYNTLERLERDGLVSKGAVDAQGHVYYEITEAGRIEVRNWLRSPVPRQTGTRHELPIKLALAVTLPGADVETMIRRQREASAAALDELHRMRYEGDSDGEELAWQLVADSLIFQAEAEVRWIDHVASRIRSRAPQTHALQISSDKPRRGRPPRGESAAARHGRGAEAFAEGASPSPSARGLGQ